MVEEGRGNVDTIGLKIWRVCSCTIYKGYEVWLKLWCVLWYIILGSMTPMALWTMCLWVAAVLVSCCVNCFVLRGSICNDRHGALATGTPPLLPLRSWLLCWLWRMPTRAPSSGRSWMLLTRTLMEVSTWSKWSRFVINGVASWICTCSNLGYDGRIHEKIVVCHI